MHLFKIAKRHIHTTVNITQHVYLFEDVVHFHLDAFSAFSYSYVFVHFIEFFSNSTGRNKDASYQDPILFDGNSISAYFNADFVEKIVTIYDYLVFL